MLISEAINEFLEFVQYGKRQSSKTFENYTHWLDRFKEYIGEEFRTSNLTVSHIDSYRRYLLSYQTSKGSLLSINTQNYHIIAVRALIRHLYDRDKTKIRPGAIFLPKLESPKMDYLKTEEMMRILNYKHAPTCAGFRNQAIISLLYSSGIRVAELVSLNRDSLDFLAGSFVVEGKSRKRRAAFFNKETGDIIQNYLKYRIDDLPALFISFSAHQGHEARLSKVMAEKIIRDTAKAVGINKKITPHSFRHFYGTNMMNSGINLRYIQEFLGHANISTTQRYLNVDTMDLQKVHNQHFNL